MLLATIDTRVNICTAGPLQMSLAASEPLQLPRQLPLTLAILSKTSALTAQHNAIKNGKRIIGQGPDGIHQEDQAAARDW